ncbi:MAG: type II toxin-antitoxin system prevent-host-death family antitoxin [Treponema sp.]|nr:type II toxin-antitoxin system prevent-host-death family antitoxin [Treponema sp.]
MPNIIPNIDLLENYNAISELCHKYPEPIFITKNGAGDLALMSVETYELLAGKIELYSLLGEGLDQVKQGKVKPIKGAINSIREKINQ